MPDTTQLPHLLNLLDDESETVRDSVAQALKAFGPDLEIELSKLPEPPDSKQLQTIRAMVGPDEQEPEFKPGQLVKHKRYGYRGVVVALDHTCQATAAWYENNRTQPDRDQPWYHVLVHNSDQTTYAAQTSLEADDSEEDINHPWVKDFFTDFHDGQYIRNNRPWLT